MSRPLWTTGPWLLDERSWVAYGEPRRYIDGRGGEKCLYTHIPLISPWDHTSFDEGKPNRDRALANMRLIAAAPELYDALLEMIERHPTDKTLARKRARAALAKARGG